MKALILNFAKQIKTELLIGAKSAGMALRN